MTVLSMLIGAIALVAICALCVTVGLQERGADQPTDDERADDERNADRLNMAFREASEPMPLEARHVRAHQPWGAVND